MKRRRGFFGVFLFFLFLSLFLFFAFRTSLLNALYGYVQRGALPLQRAIHISFWNLTNKNPQEQQLIDENRKLREQLVTMQELKRENEALHDQFESTEVAKYEQIPSRIVGTNGFIPGVSLASQFILDKGEREGVVKGNAVIYGNNMVGRVIRVTPHMSLVDSVMRQGFSVTGRDLATSALGVIKGQGEGVILDNVVLSDKLQVGDIVVTKGDMNENGIGIPPDLVIGKISSIDRRPSNLFQSAEVQSLTDLNRLSTVLF